jgi:tetratricopeptide (TPR) repeat protein/TolB-like protein
VCLPRLSASRLADRQDEATAGATPPGLVSPPGSGQASQFTQPAFAADDLLAGRFRLIRVIGKGGMGQVYEAEDLELREHVALKAVRPEIAHDSRSIERFKREIHLARQVTHPNVCRIFDVFHHPITAPDGTTEGEITFLSMELLAGETLAERIRRDGPMTTGEALPLVQQMAAALAAAHKVGIVHRDFKSQNVMLVPAVDPAQGIRAVVTDFGLARGAAGADKFASSATGISDFVGSPPYMAPEQVEGGEVGAAADIYALGVVMYEVVSGRLPFVGDTPLSTAMKRLKEAPPPPHLFVPDLDPKWEATILQCLERDPRERFASASDVVKALAAEEVSTGRRARIRRFVLVAAGALILLGLAAASSLHVWRKAGSGPPPAAAVVPLRARRCIAVLGFKNLSGEADSAWLSTAISEILSTDLATDGQLRTIPGEDVARVKIGLSLPETDGFARDTLGRLRGNLGADLVVVGSYIMLGKGATGQLRVDLRLQDTSSGETVATVAETGAESNLLDVVERGGRAVREKLGLSQLSPDEFASVRAAMPSNPEAARLYSEGLAELRRFDGLAARDSLERAVALDPKHALAHSALAAAWSALGYEAKAILEAKKAYQLSTDLSQPADLSQQERLTVEGRFREMTHDWNKAVEIYASLFDLFPDNIDYGLWLASVETSAGQGRNALATLAKLRELPPPARDDPRIDLEEARAADSLSDFKLELAAATRAVEKGSADGSRLLVARGRRAQGWAYKDLGQPDQATGAFREAQMIFSAAGDRTGVATVLNDLAVVHWQQGDFIGVMHLYTQAFAIYREIGNKNGAAGVLNNMGIVLWQQGDLAGADKMYREALAAFREAGNKEATARVLNDEGYLLWQQGDLAGARTRLREALSIFREIGNNSGMASALQSRGVILWQQGDLPAAQQQLQESLETFRRIGDKNGTAEALISLGRLVKDQGDLDGARKQFEEAAATASEIGGKAVVAKARLALGDVAMEKGSFQEAETAARDSAKEFSSEKAIDYEGLASVLLARSLLAEGKASEAQAAIGRATSAPEHSRNRYNDLLLAITAARVQAASGQRGDLVEAGKVLRSALGAATELGFVGLQFEARLAQGEINSPRSSQNRARLHALEKDATAKGFRLIAGKAAAILEKDPV